LVYYTLMLVNRPILILNVTFVFPLYQRNLSWF
jgi:hypothetical protein